MGWWASVSDRIASTVIVTGLTFAHAWSQPGMLATGTKAALAKVSGKIHTKLAAWTDSTFRMAKPMEAEIHEKAWPKARARTIAPTAARNPTWKDRKSVV